MSNRNSPTKPFLFVEQSGDVTHRVSNDTRRQIRRQAMRDVGHARRQSGNYGKHNQRQYPLFEETPMDVSTNVSASGYTASTQAYMEPSTGSIRAQQADPWVMPPAMPAHGYERVRMEFDFDILSLSALTTVHFNRAAVQALSQTPSQLRYLLQVREASYLDFVPSYYSSSSLLRSVIDCTVAQARRVVTPGYGVTEVTVLALYDKVLPELQSALSDPERWRSEEVLCATQILSLYELLDFYQPQRWLHHAVGAANLIKQRGHDNYRTEFEQTLFLSHIGSTMSECLLRNEDCFLEEPEWQEIISSLSTEESPRSERHPIVTSLWGYMTPIPRLFRETTEYICHQENSDAALESRIVLQAQQTHRNLLQWGESHIIFSQQHQAQSRYLKLNELIGLASAMQILLQRIIVALQPAHFEAVELEQETQRLADKVVDLKDAAIAAPNPKTRILLAQKTFVANAAIASRDEWSDVVLALPYALDERGVVNAAIFRVWCERLGRRID